MADQPPASEPAPAPASSYTPRYVDIGINLADPIFRGRYNGAQRHPDDLEAIVDRAKEVGCSKLLVTGSDFASNRDALKLVEQFPGTVYATVGIHPCSSSVFSATRPRRRSSSSSAGHTTPCSPDRTTPPLEGQEPDAERSASAITRLKGQLAQGGAAAFGEFGLDYDRLFLCSRAVQLHSFAAQLRVAAELKPQLPLFLHSRAAHEDFSRLLRDAFGPHLERLERGGVVHSFTGSAQEARELLDLGLYIGINGCSFKTEENCAVVADLPLDRIMLETDGPWCEVRPSHAGYKYLIEKPAVSESAQEQQPKKKKNQKKEPDFPERFKSVKKEKWQEGAMVKGRNEPCTIERVAKIVAAIKGLPLEDVCEAAWRNSVAVFGLGERDS